MHTKFTLARVASMLAMALGFVVVALATPADAKSYLDAGSGVWDGYRNGVYEGHSKRAWKKSGIVKQSASKKSGKKYAALNKNLTDAYAPRKSVASSGGGVRWVASSGCLNGRLKSIMYSVAANYGSVTVSSTCRSRGHNARVGGAKKSQHLSGNAVDFRVHGNIRGAYAYLAGAGRVGGFKHYGGGLFHIDTGPVRSW